MRNINIIVNKIMSSMILFFMFNLILILFISQVYAENEDNIAVKRINRIHYITSDYSSSDAIILESNGKFAMIDTGEDSDYPDGGDPRYPLRSGTTRSDKLSLTDKVLSYLDRLGVKEIEFIIGTHVHSDHIGNVDEIINRYKVKKLYLKEYSDDRIIDKNRLWDNLYVYDRAIMAANQNGVELIQNITEPEFDFGDMHISLYNYQNEYNDNGELKKVYDDNVNSIVTVINVNGQRIYLGGDIDNQEDREYNLSVEIGAVDMMKLNHHGIFTLSNSFKTLANHSPKIVVKTAAYDLDRKLFEWLNNHNIEIVSAGRRDTSAIVFDITVNGFKNITDSFVTGGIFSKKLNKFLSDNDIADDIQFLDWSKKPISDKGWIFQNNKYYYINDADGHLLTRWSFIDGSWYYFDNMGRMVTGWIDDSNSVYYLKSDGKMAIGWQWIETAWYYFNESGKMEIGWLKDGDKWYHLEKDGKMSRGWVEYNNEKYYTNQSGEMLTGWQWIETAWYYFNKNGNMKTGWLKDGNYWYYLKNNGVMAIGWIYDNGVKYYFDKSGRLV